mmetsp:Transcript_27850/g.43217  ORF Transcript_27850/g.43217 Transcript_27850/m.43217 type:complete len:442 (-) Transcript_27850:347-1672(-)
MLLQKMETPTFPLNTSAAVATATGGVEVVPVARTVIRAADPSRLVYLPFFLISFLVFCFMSVKVAVETTYSAENEVSDTVTGATHSFLTILLPSVVNPKGRLERLKAIADTWGPSANAVFVVHADESIPSILSWGNTNYSSEEESSSNNDKGPISYPALLRVPPDITVEYGVERLIHVMKTIVEAGPPDFIFFANDHTFIIPEHLCLFLQDLNPGDDIYLGHALGESNRLKYGFNSGASGYILSKNTLRKLVAALDAKKPKCTSDGSGWLAGNPGILTAACLGDTLGTPPIDTRNSDGEHLFHAFGLARVVSGQVDQWYINKHKNLYFLKNGDTIDDHLPHGEHCCGAKTISFHYVEYSETRQLFAARNYIAEAASLGHPLSDKRIGRWLDDNWPEKNKLGFYAHDIPPSGTEGRRQFISVLRKISNGRDKLPLQCRKLVL